MRQPSATCTGCKRDRGWSQGEGTCLPHPHSRVRIPRIQGSTRPARSPAARSPEIPTVAMVESSHPRLTPTIRNMPRCALACRRVALGYRTDAPEIPALGPKAATAIALYEYGLRVPSSLLLSIANMIKYKAVMDIVTLYAMKIKPNSPISEIAKGSPKMPVTGGAWRPWAASGMGHGQSLGGREWACG